MHIEIRREENTRIELRLRPNDWHLRTEYLEPGFPDPPGNWWAYKTPVVYDTNARRWEINYRTGEEWIPHLTRAEAERCAEIISEFDNELFF